MNGLREKANNPSQSTGYSQLNQVASGGQGWSAGWKTGSSVCILGEENIPTHLSVKSFTPWFCNLLFIQRRLAEHAAHLCVMHSHPKVTHSPALQTVDRTYRGLLSSLTPDSVMFRITRLNFNYVVPVSLCLDSDTFSCFGTILLAQSI